MDAPTTIKPDSGNKDGRVGPWIQTFSGRKFFVFDPRPEDVDIEDIAHGLSNTCRFSGQVSKFYSVAQHSVLVSQCVFLATGSSSLALSSLLHDASEAYTGDFPSPWKKLVLIDLPSGTVPFQTCEDRITYTVFRALNAHGVLMVGDEVVFDPEPWKVIKRYDKILLATEARDLMRGANYCAWRNSLDPEHPPLKNVIEPVPPEIAESLFLDRWRMYTSSCHHR